MRSINLLLIAFFLLSTDIALADLITVSGDVSGTWSADTMLVTGEIRVPPGETLTIMPGVEVLFEVYCKFIVDSTATLIAVGDLNDVIRFDELTPGIHWHGIRFWTASDSSRLEYCHMYNGSATGSGEDFKGGAIYCSSSNPTIQNCLIENCSATDGGAIFCIASDPNIICNTISTNTALDYGGGICCYNSNPGISGNTIHGNSAEYGGGIYCYDYSPDIHGNTISGNSATRGGGISCYYYASPSISGNTIHGNSAYYGGGGIRCSYSSPDINGNMISQNTGGQGGGISCENYSDANIHSNLICVNSGSYGGGIACYYSSPYIGGNIIYGNDAANSGGGVRCGLYSYPTIGGNTLSGNSADFYGGGGIFCHPFSGADISGNTIKGNSATEGGGVNFWDSPSVFEHNEITYNTASGDGGGIYSTTTGVFNKNTVSFNEAAAGGGLYSSGYYSPELQNCILWENAPEQIAQSPSSTIQATYCNIQGGWTGTGNIDEDPMFVNPFLSNCHLQWDSPCIDSGDPDPQYNDPDGTRADMGAFYFNQSIPVRILITPHDIPFMIPEEGGSLDYCIQVENVDSLPHSIAAWCDITLPDSTLYGPVLGPVTITLEPGVTIERVRIQTVPPAAPMGVYHYNAYAVVDSDTSKDSFMFGKLGTGTGGIDGWGTAGDPIIDTGGSSSLALQMPHLAVMNHPNPFNPTTTISFTLAQTCFVRLEVFDVTGRNISSPLLNGWREAGQHSVVFDGSDLSSGVYAYHLQAGDFTASGKIVLLK